MGGDKRKGGEVCSVVASAIVSSQPLTHFCSCLNMPQASVIDHTYTMHPMCRRLTLHMRTPSSAALVFMEVMQNKIS